MIKILQRCHKFLNMQNMKKMIDNLVKSKDLLVVVNTLPLYMMTQMFFASDCVMTQEHQEITQNVFDLIQGQINDLKNRT